MQKLTAEQSFKLPSLNQYIESVRVYQNKSHQMFKELFFEGYPEGVFELIIQSDRSVLQKNSNESIWRQREVAFVSGLHQQSFQLKIPPETEFTSVRFKHGAFKYLFSGRLNDFINQTVPIIDLWSSEGKKLQSKFNNASCYQQKVLALADFVETKINSKKHSIIDGCVDAILSNNGVVNLIELERRARLSPAQFRKRFREEVGLPPKKFAKVIRIKSIIDELERSKSQSSLTEVVYNFGYFDQSHFIKDFKSIIGVTPTMFTSKSYK